MKKIFSSVTFFLSLGIFFALSSYTQGSFNYHVADFFGYLFYWSVTLFIVSLFAFVLDNTKYKVWLLVTLVYVFMSILLAYGTGDGNGSILSFDGEMVTWFFSGLYFFVSVIYLIVQFFKNKNKKKTGAF